MSDRKPIAANFCVCALSHQSEEQAMSQPRSVPHPRRFMRGLLMVIGLCLLVAVRAAEPPAKKMSPEERQAKVKERDRLWAETQKLRAENKLPEAVAAAEKMLAIERNLFGNNSA